MVGIPGIPLAYWEKMLPCSCWLATRNTQPQPKPQPMANTTQSHIPSLSSSEAEDNHPRRLLRVQASQDLTQMAGPILRREGRRNTFGWPPVSSQIQSQAVSFLHVCLQALTIKFACRIGTWTI